MLPNNLDQSQIKKKATCYSCKGVYEYRDRESNPKIYKCNVCKKNTVCINCNSMVECEKCGVVICGECEDNDAFACYGCGEVFCTDCCKGCYICSSVVCDECAYECDCCDRIICKQCRKKICQGCFNKI